MQNIIKNLKELNILTESELIELKLRKLYAESGYKLIRPKKFEQAELYIDNKNFVGSGGIITFMDADGHLLSLKPDATLSIVKKAVAAKESQKLYYSDEVYRLSSASRQYEAIEQIGLEYIGKINGDATKEIITLAINSLKTISDNCILDISHLSFISPLLEGLEANLQNAIFENIKLKSCHGMEQTLENVKLDDNLKTKITKLTQICGEFPHALKQAESLIVSKETETAYIELEDLYKSLCSMELSDNIILDFSAVNDLSYYNGIVFKGYVKEDPSTVLSGGRYDNLVRKMGGNFGAMGFAVKLGIRT